MTVESPAFASANSTFQAEQTRRALSCVYQRGSTIGSIAGGLVNQGDCQTSAGSGMTCLTAPGEAWIPGSSSSTQGGYYARIASTVTSNIAAADATNPRIDLISLVEVDKAYAGSADSTSVVVSTGSPSAGATLSNLVGAPSPPASSLSLCYVLVPANSTSISGSNLKNVAGLAYVVPPYTSGLASARPSPALLGRGYYATDTAALSFDTGSAWTQFLTSFNFLSATSQAANYTANSGDLVLAANGITVQLPAAARNAVVGIVAGSSTTPASPVTVAYGTGGGKILGPTLGTGASSLSMILADSAVLLQSDGTNWYVLAQTGGSTLSPVAVSANYTAALGDLVLVSTTSSIVTVTLPSPSASTGGSLTVAAAAVGSTSTAYIAITTPSGVIKGVGAGGASMALATVGAYVTLTSDGTNWWTVAGQQDSGWVPMTPATNIASGGYGATTRLIGDRVWLRGTLTNNGGTSTSGTLATIQTTLRPSATLLLTGMLNNVYSGQAVQITSTGALSMPNGLSPAYTVNLDGLSYTLS